MFSVLWSALKDIVTEFINQPPAIKKPVIQPSFNDLEVVAKTIWGEARGEGFTGMQAVGNVILNRSNEGGWWGSHPGDVCMKPEQFSCWNKNDPNYPKLLKVGNEDPAYRAAESIANSVLCNNLEDLTGGADSYQVIGTNAVWSRGLTPVKTIGHHEFYITRKGGA